jgi:formate-dependent nitrite reductase membrane component NrfD
MGNARRIYDVPDKGILWGWEVSAYVWTKAISAGAFLVLFIAWAFNLADFSTRTQWWGIGLGVGFLLLTGLFLVKDLDRPDRFVNVLFRPQWKSWLVRGGYSITLYGGLLALLGASTWFGWSALVGPLMWITAVTAIVVAIYTAFLFAQAKGRDFWQSPTLAIHMLVHSIIAGASIFGILGLFIDSTEAWLSLLKMIIIIGLIINLFTMMLELTITHPTSDAKKTVHMITHGKYKKKFWFGVILLGNIVPLALLFFGGTEIIYLALSGIFVLVGIFFTEEIWVEAPQRIPLS